MLNTQEEHVLKIGYINIRKSYSEKLRGINFDWRLKFSTHIEDICKKVSRKFSLQETVTQIECTIKNYLLKRRALINGFFKA